MEKAKMQLEAKQLLSDFLATKKLSKVKLAKKIGVSNAVVTYVLQDELEKLSEEMLLKITNALKSKSNEYRLIETENFNTVRELCRDASLRHMMFGLIGCTGAGKTTALKHFYRSTPNVFYVECKNIMNRKQFFAAILSELGLNAAGTVYDMVTRIIDELNSLQTPLLIIDEAGKLSHTLMLDLHDLRNATQNNLGIVFSGCEYFKDNMEVAVKRNKQGIPEFYSRIVSWQILNKPSRREVSAIFEANAVHESKLEKQRYFNFREVYNAVVNFQFSNDLRASTL